MRLYLFEAKGEALKELFEIAFEVCNKFAFIKHSQLYYNETFDILVGELKESFIYSKEQGVWPGTISAAAAIVYYFKCSERAKDIIVNSSNSLFDWKAPFLPDDICFFKDEKVWLTTTTHEHIYYIDTEESIEIDKLSRVYGLIYDIK